MALPGTDYNPATGLDLSGGSNVAEYVINEFGGAAFRHWKTPFSPSALQAQPYPLTPTPTPTFTPNPYPQPQPQPQP